MKINPAFEWINPEAASRVVIVWYKQGKEPIRLHELSQVFINKAQQLGAYVRKSRQNGKQEVSKINVLLDPPGFTDRQRRLYLPHGDRPLVRPHSKLSVGHEAHGGGWFLRGDGGVHLLGSRWKRAVCFLLLFLRNLPHDGQAIPIIGWIENIDIEMKILDTKLAGNPREVIKLNQIMHTFIP